MKGTVHVYRDRKGQWRWRAVAKNGNKVANCGESLRRRSHALDQARIEACARDFAIEIQRPKSTARSRGRAARSK